MTRRLAILDDHPPGPGYDANRDLLVKLLAQVGLVYQSCLHVGPDELAKLTEWQPHMILVLDWQRDKKRSGLLALTGEKKAIDDWRGSVLQAKLVVPGTKLMATYHPNRLKVEWGLTGVVRFDMKRLAEELQTDTLDVPVDDIEINLTKDQLVERLRDIYENDRTTAPDLEGYPDWITCIGFATGPNKAFVVPLIHEDGTSWWPEEDELELLTWIAKVLEKPTCQKRMHNGSYEVFCTAWSYGIVIDGFVDDTMLLWFELFCELEKNLGFVSSILTKQPWYKHQRKSTDESTQLYYNGRDCCRTYGICDKMLPMLKPKQAEHYRFNMEVLAPINFMALRGMRYDAEAAKTRLERVQQEIYELQDQINREAASGRPDLRAFYAALDGGGCQAGLPGEAACQRLDTRPSLVSLFTQAFCKAESLRRERRQVHEVWWQPRKWNGKKWVKAGKQTKGPVEGPCGQEPPGDIEATWFQPFTKQVTKLVPVAIQTFEDVSRFVLGSKATECKRAIQLVRRLADAQHQAAGCGELATLLGIHVKLNATGRGKDVTQADGTVERGAERDANWFVYDHCKAPKQYARENGKPTDRLTSSTPAVLLAYIATQDPRLRTFMSWRAADTMREALTAKADPDGRIRCSYILPGTNTCRIACKEGNTGSGYNLQTVTEPLRYLFPADEGCDFGQIDLKGADGWTIAALCAELDDRTMLDDLLFGLKPVNIIVLLYTEGPHINQLSREELKVAQKRVDKASWQYIATKPIFYGYTYLMGARKMSEGIAEDSYAETGVATVVSPAKCEGIMRMIDARYPGIKRVQAAAANRMMNDGVLLTSQGWQRRFYGRKSHKVQVNGEWVTRPDRTTHGAWLGTLPQFITTYVTKLGLAKLWADPDNRRPDGSLRVEPLHTVHDSLNPMWRVEDREFAKAKILPVWFNNEVQVAGQTLSIPASGTYGPSWGQQDQAL